MLQHIILISISSTCNNQFCPPGGRATSCKSTVMLAHYCLIKVVRRTSAASSDMKPSQRHMSVHLESCLCRPDEVKLNTHSAFSSLLVSTSFSGKCLSLLNPSLFSLVSCLLLFNSGPAANSRCLYFSFLPAGFGHKVYESMNRSHSVRVDITAALTTEQCIMLLQSPST